MNSVGKAFMVPLLLDFNLELLYSQILEGADVLFDSHGEDFGVLDEMDFWARRQRGLCWRGRARSGSLGWR
jgi:hypothetical protein